MGGVWNAKSFVWKARRVNHQKLGTDCLQRGTVSSGKSMSYLVLMLQMPSSVCNDR